MKKRFSFFLLEHPGPAARPQGQGPVSGDPAAYPASAAAGLIGRDLQRKLLCQCYFKQASLAGAVILSLSEGQKKSL